MSDASIGQGMLSMSINDTHVLHSVYMPFIRNGGLFVPTDRPYQLGDDLIILLQLLQEPDRVPVSGKVVWITPTQAGGQRAQGVGIAFDEREGKQLKARIENYLAGYSGSQRPTQTM